MSGVVQLVKSWIDEPFTTPLDTKSIFLLVGVVLIAIILWNFVLFHVRIAAERAI